MTSALRNSIQKLLKPRGVSRLSGSRPKTCGIEQNILKSIYPDIPKFNCSVNEFVWLNLDRWPDKTATVCAVTGHGYTYAQTHKMSVVFAASLRKKLKLQNDDKVAVILPNTPEYPITVLGILQAGGVATMMNPAYKPAELKHQLELIQCKAIVTSKLSYRNVLEALNMLKTNIPIILVDNDNIPEGAIKFAEFAEDMNVDIDCLKSIQRNPEDVAILPFSSGTTGLPKAVVLNHGSVVAFNQMIAGPEIADILEITDKQQSTFLAILPFFHIFGFNAVMMNQLHLGCKLVTMPYFKPELFLHSLVKHKVDCLFIVPPMVIFLGKHPSVTPEHLQHLRCIVSGAAPASADDALSILKKNENINFRQGYGLTETNGGVSIAHKRDRNFSAVGHPFPSCQIKIADTETQEALGAGQEGEIWFRGPSLMSGYYKNELETKAALTEDGWYKTGDIGKYDENKYLYVTDRMKELIKVKGFQVSPSELEAVIRTHPKVLDCAVIGIPNAVSGELPKALLVPKPGQTIIADEIIQYVNPMVSSFKQITNVQIVDDIPKTPAGKILRKELKKMYC